MKLTASEQRAVNDLRAKQDQERKARLGCGHCGAEMEYVATLAHGDGQGAGAVYLLQCPKCMKVETRDRV